MNVSPALEIRRAALDLLARRDHSNQELQQKLEARFPGDRELIKAVVLELAEQGLQSDVRRCEEFVRVRAGRGQGPLKIGAELRRLGIDEAQIEQALREAGVDWSQQALRARQRKFGMTAPDFRGRARIGRFLQGRGFTSDQVRYALGSAQESH